MRRTVLAAAWAALLFPEQAFAGDDDFTAITVVRPAGGFLATDGVSSVPLEITMRGSRGPVPIAKAEVRASLGTITGTKIIGPGRVSFLYSPPRRDRAASEMLDISLRLQNGDERLEAYPIEVPPPGTPGLSLQVDPTELDASAPRNVEVSAIARGEGLQELAVHSSHGLLKTSGPERGPRGEITSRVTLVPPMNLPDDAPSHFIVLAIASGKTGFTAQAIGVSMLAPIEISADITPGSFLVLEGAERDPEPVAAPADGKTVIRGTVRYGATIRAFSQRGRRRSEIPIVVPTGLVPPGLAAPIPGQDVADGAVGPSIVVALPPSPFGGVEQPEIEVEGAKLASIVELAGDLRALVLERPATPRKVTVLADGVPIGAIEFKPGHGTTVELQADYPRKGERGAVNAIVKDPLGTLTDTPVPRARLASGPELPVERSAQGRFRIALPPSTPGAPAEEVTVNVELVPAPVVAGDPPELAFASQKVRLEGPPPAIKAGGATEVPIDEVTEVEDGGDDGPGLRLGLAAAAIGGTTLGVQPMFGGGAFAELRLPLWDWRLGLRAGIEYFHISGSGTLAYTEGETLEASSTVAGVLVPIDIGVAVVKTEGFELVARGGLSLRFDRGAVDVGGERIAGGSSFGVSGEVGAEAAFTIGSGALFGGVTFGGLGASAGGLSTPNAALDGTLANVRLGIGFRVWL